MTREPTRAHVGPDAESVRDLAVRARAGSHAAFGALVERFEAPLFHFLRVRTGSDADAEELTQEAFLKAWRRIELYDEHWAFSTWLFTVAGRIATSRGRRAVLPVASEEPCDQIAGALDPGEEASARDECANVWRVAERVLSAEQRSALWLYYAEELAVRDVACILGRSESTVRVLLFRARKRLATHLGAPDSPSARSCFAGHPLPAAGGRP